jgi:hypothetical protein
MGNSGGVKMLLLNGRIIDRRPVQNRNAGNGVRVLRAERGTTGGTILQFLR